MTDRCFALTTRQYEVKLLLIMGCKHVIKEKSSKYFKLTGYNICYIRTAINSSQMISMWLYSNKTLFMLWVDP